MNEAKEVTLTGAQLASKTECLRQSPGGSMLDEMVAKIRGLEARLAKHLDSELDAMRQYHSVTAANEKHYRRVLELEELAKALRIQAGNFRHSLDEIDCLRMELTIRHGDSWTVAMRACDIAKSTLRGTKPL
jgi:hypothetical protein